MTLNRMQQPVQLRAEVAPPEDDQRLVAAVLTKDRKATAEFVSRCAEWVYPYVRWRTMPNSEAVEDLMQEIMLAAWRSLPSFRGTAGLKPWIMGIARHKVEDYYRSRLATVELTEQEIDGPEPEVPPLIQEELERKVQDRKVQATLAQLPEPYGLALLWRYRDSRTVREIAQQTGKTEKAVERLLARARAAFKRRWRDD